VKPDYRGNGKEPIVENTGKAVAIAVDDVGEELKALESRQQ
jgi:hypothetical protein